MPYTTLVSGTTITASWANANVRDQSITPFASVSARDSAITVPVNGMFAYTTDTQRLWRYNGALAKWLVERTTITKLADTSYGNTTTLANDPQLQWPVDTNSTYFFVFDVLWLATTTIGYEQGFNFPAGSRVDYGRLSQDGTGALLHDAKANLTTTGSQGFFGSTITFNWGHARISGSITTTNNAGTFAWQAAQHVSNATNAFTLQGSTVVYNQVA